MTTVTTAASTPTALGDRVVNGFLMDLNIRWIIGDPSGRLNLRRPAHDWSVFTP
jgi:hypothetical protein